MVVIALVILHFWVYNILSFDGGIALILMMILIRCCIYEYYSYTPSNAVGQVYKEEDCNHLVTNDGYLYRSTATKHVERVFMERATAKNISDIWIKCSPCVVYSHKLIKYFSSCKDKPTIYFANIWRPGNMDDKEGLTELTEEGFKIKEWTKLKKRMAGTNNCAIL